MQNNGGFFQKLWSSKSVSRQQPTTSSSKSPSFNASSFGSSLGASVSNTDSPSSFYAGRVRYGGAMSASRNNLTSPYVVPSITKAKRKSKNVDESQNSKVLNKKVSGTLSSTARRIFQALEKMSTPLRDIKKIPPPSITKSSVFGKPQRKRSIGATLLESSKRSCPPSRGITKSSRATQSSTPTIPLDNSLSTQSILKNISADSQTTSSPVVFKGKPAIMASLSSSVGMKLKNSSVVKRPGGKMRVPRKTAAHYSNVIDNEEIEEQGMPDLNSIPIAVSSLPEFDFGGPGSTSTPALPKSNTSKAPNLATKSIVFSEPVYTFSPPAVAPSPRKHLLSDGKFSENFQFSSPLSTKQKTKKVVNTQSNPDFAQKNISRPQPNISQPKSTPVLNTHGSVMDILGNKPNSFKNSEKQKISIGDSNKIPKPSLGEMFKMSNDMWECKVCMVKNSKDATNCVSCQSKNPVQKDLVVNNAANDWTCDVSSIKNKNTRDISEACESPRRDKEMPNPLLVKSNSSKWECEVCMVKNDNERESCEACQAPKPGKKSQTKSKGSKLSEWQCDICLVFNDPKVVKCIACETPKSTTNPLPKNPPAKVFSSNVGAFGTTSTSQNFSFGISKEKPVSQLQNDQNRSSSEASETVKPGHKQNSNKAEFKSSLPFKSGVSKANTSSKWVCQVCLVPNDAERSQCIACESPKLGSENTEASKPQKTSSFKFGSTSNTVFQFGNSNKALETSTSNNTNLKPSSKAATSVADSVQTGFKFSAPSSFNNDKLVSSAPASASQKNNSVSFNFGNESAPTIGASVKNEAPKPTFSFGEKSQVSGNDPPVVKATLVDSSVQIGSTNVGFSFGTKSQAESKPALKKLNFANSSEINIPTCDTFGATSSEIQFKLTQSQPTLGIPKVTDSSAKSEPPKLPFSFGTKAQTAPPNQQMGGVPSFTFGTKSTSSSGSTLSAAPPKFAGFSTSLDKNISSTAVEQSTGSGSAIKNMLSSKQPLLFGSATTHGGEPSTVAKLPSSDQKTSSNLSATTSKNNASGFQFPASQSQQPQPGFAFGSKPTSGFSQDPPSFGSRSTTTAGNEGFSKLAQPKPTPFNTLAQQKIGGNSASSTFSGFGTKQGDNSTFGQDTGSLPKPSFSFGNSASSNAGPQGVSSSVFGSNAGASQSSGFTFGSSNTGSKPQTQNPPAFGSSQAAAKPTFGFGSADPPKPSSTFQFGTSQSTQPTLGGFGFGNAQNQSDNSAPSSGFNFSAAAQNATKPMFSSIPASGFQFGAGAQNQAQMQSKPDSTSGFAFGASSGPPPSFGQNMPSTNSAGSMFSIGQSNTQGRSTPVRPTKQARRRLRPTNKN